MLKSELPEINLDDQSYGEILKSAVGRIPWLDPEWTDFNAHDPGITLLELLAWYKETQQYHLNFIPEQTYRALIKLLGLKLSAESCAECLVRLPYTGSGKLYPAKSRFETPDGVCFELENELDPDYAFLKSIYILDGGENGEAADVTALLSDRLIAVPPFDYAGKSGTSMLLRFGKLSGGRLTLQFCVSDGLKVARNQFDENDDYQPRSISYSLEGFGELEVLCDTTHSMSMSGYVTLCLPDAEKLVKTDGGHGLGEDYYIKVALNYGGCEETVRLLTVFCDLYPAKQRRTLALTSEKTAHDGILTFSDALSLEGEVLAFARDENSPDRLTMAQIVSVNVSDGVKTLEITLDGMSYDGPVVCVALDPLMCGEMLFDSNGLPGQTLRLNTMSQKALVSELRLICDTLMPDGSVCPAVWTPTDNLKAHGPRDRVFTYDSDTGTITFGDGLCGAMLPKGRNAALISSLAVSLCGGGNIPAGDFIEALAYPDEGNMPEMQEAGSRVWHTEAVGGRDAEKSADAVKRLPALLDSPKKCASLSDYERLALSTPGLRIASAKAIPCYDPDSPVDTSSRAGSKDSPAVTVAVLPYSDRNSSSGRSLPDENFLRRVSEYVGRYRPVCSVVRIIAPKYLAVSVSVKLSAYDSKRVTEEAEAALDDYFSRDGIVAIGRDVSKDSLTAALYRIDGVKRVVGLDINAMDAGAYQSADGTLRIPQNAAAYLASADIQIV